MSHSSIELTICCVTIHALSQVSNKLVYINEVVSGQPTSQSSIVWLL